MNDFIESKFIKIFTIYSPIVFNRNINYKLYNTYINIYEENPTITN